MAHIMLVQTIESKLSEKQFVDSVAHICRKENRKLWVLKNAFTAREIKKKKLLIHFKF